MSFGTDIAWKSLNKHGEELCGDMVKDCQDEGLRYCNSSRRYGKRSKGKHFGYSDFSDFGHDALKRSKHCVLCGDHRKDSAHLSGEKCGLRHFLNSSDLPRWPGLSGGVRQSLLCLYKGQKDRGLRAQEQIIDGKKIKEYRFQAKENDCFVLMSDGVIFAGAGELLNYGWTWESMAEYTLRCTRNTMSASRLVSMLSGACKDLYEHAREMTLRLWWSEPEKHRLSTF